VTTADAVARELREVHAALASLVADAARLAATPELARVRALAEQAKAPTEKVVAARRELQALAEPGLTRPEDPAAIRAAVACARAVIELEPAARALGDVPLAAARAAAPDVAARAVHLFLSIGHRQCLAALDALGTTRSDR
jgi:hypothetical protein